MEFIIGITGLVLVLIVIYLASPSIFNLVSSLDQDIFGRQLLYHNNNNINGGGNNLILYDMSDEYESDEDNITVIDISKPVTNQQPKPKKRFRDNNNLMLLSVDDELDQ